MIIRQVLKNGKLHNCHKCYLPIVITPIFVFLYIHIQERYASSTFYIITLWTVSIVSKNSGPTFVIFIYNESILNILKNKLLLFGDDTEKNICINYFF